MPDPFNLPDPKGGPALLSPETYVKFKQALELLNLTLEPRDFVVTDMPGGGRRVQIRAYEEFLQAVGAGGVVSNACTELVPSVLNVGTEQAPDWRVFVSSGIVNNLVPTIGGVPLNNDPAPSLALTVATSLWLRFGWTPIAQQFDNAGTPFYYVGNGGTISNVRFELSATQPAEVVPTVDSGSGAVTAGESSFLWANVSENNGAFSLSEERSCNVQIGFCAPNQWTLYREMPAEGGGGGGYGPYGPYGPYF